MTLPVEAFGHFEPTNDVAMRQRLTIEAHAVMITTTVTIGGRSVLSSQCRGPSVIEADIAVSLACLDEAIRRNRTPPRPDAAVARCNTRGASRVLRHAYCAARVLRSARPPQIIQRLSSGPNNKTTRRIRTRGTPNNTSVQ